MFCCSRGHLNICRRAAPLVAHLWKSAQLVWAGTSWLVNPMFFKIFLEILKNICTAPLGRAPSWFGQPVNHSTNIFLRYLKYSLSNHYFILKIAANNIDVLQYGPLRKELGWLRLITNHCMAKWQTCKSLPCLDSNMYFFEIRLNDWTVFKPRTNIHVMECVKKTTGKEFALKDFFSKLCKSI